MISEFLLLEAQLSSLNQLEKLGRPKRNRWVVERSGKAPLTKGQETCLLCLFLLKHDWYLGCLIPSQDPSFIGCEMKAMGQVTFQRFDSEEAGSSGSQCGILWISC